MYRVRPSEQDAQQLTPAGQIYAKLPDAIKQEIGKYTPLVEKSSEGLHTILQNLRRQFNIPPWHEITLYFKLTAAKSVNSTNDTWERFELDRKTYTDIIPDVKTWLWMFVTVKRGDDESIKQLVAVRPDKKHPIIWNVRTDRQIKCDTFSAKQKSSANKYMCLRASRIYNKAEELLAAGKTGADEPEDVIFVLDSETAEVTVKSNKVTEPVKQAQKLAAQIRDNKTPEDYKPPMFPFDYDIRKESLPPSKHGVILTTRQETLLNLMGEISSAQLEKLGAQETAFEIKALVKQLTGATNE